MKTLITTFALLLATHLSAQKITRFLFQDTSVWSQDGVTHKDLSHHMVVEGVYNNKDVMIRNSFGKSGIGFCLTGLKINGNYTTDEINAEIFKVDLSLHKLKKGEKFEMKIYYKDNCGPIKEPIIMNPGAIKAEDPSGKNSLIIEGKNYNASLLVVNPRSGNGYGIKEVLVNGKPYTNINSDVFELSFFKMGIPYEEKLKIEFKYENGCDPFFVNPEVINY
jgi:hypothetical protein